MGRVQTAGEAASRPLSPSRLPLRAHFHRGRDVWVPYTTVVVWICVYVGGLRNSPNLITCIEMMNTYISYISTTELTNRWRNDHCSKRRNLCCCELKIQAFFSQLPKSRLALRCSLRLKSALKLATFIDLHLCATRAFYPTIVLPNLKLPLVVPTNISFSPFLD